MADGSRDGSEAGAAGSRCSRCGGEDPGPFGHGDDQCIRSLASRLARIEEVVKGTEEMTRSTITLLVVVREELRALSARFEGRLM